ncbi:protein arginine n-methyltransferase [Nesidiocoris tenuis]|uniref:Protein arginine N-methyltransferase n=1 Tax=Nesidiocoris tenuis TaxID=355587 RepID=A0ABN7B7F7_9HEMI|nr:protein arginine n-methyltransferase [Nesidiocoris tenuis]
MSRKPKNCGLDVAVASNLNATIQLAHDCGYNFVCVPLAHPMLRRDMKTRDVDAVKGRWVRTDLVLGASEWQYRVVPRLSPWLNLDSPNEAFRKNSEEIFLQELQFAHHLGIRGIVMDLHQRHNPNLAQCLNKRLHTETSTYLREEIWLQIPTSSRATNSYRNDVIETDDESEEDTWHWWNDVRLMCQSHARLMVVLELTADLPEEGLLDRWHGEPIELLIVPTSIFLTNKGGFPTLSKAHQRFVMKCALRNTAVLVSGANRHGSLKHYIQYIRNLYQKAEVPPSRQHDAGFEDTLQMPLQPLADHLESFTYEVFEKDPVKYSEYGNAVYKALLDRVPESEAATATQVIMVVGAGRGPLVTQSILAAKEAKRNVRIYAVEKNPNAVQTLLDLKKEDWGEIVTVVHTDMRKWNAPEKCDILVSELLGSFGDNELSPECLDGAQVFLKDDGISIPSSYRSFIQPMMSMKYYNEARNLKLNHHHPTGNFEQTYVVALGSSYMIAPVQQLFEFVHPNKSPAIDNSRYKSLKFTAQEDSTMYGFTGYFDTTLYKDVRLSIVPETFSVGMFSWFPVYIPIQEPIYVRKGEIIEVVFWRRHDEKRVWYEWCITNPRISGIHNVNGRSSAMNL